MPADEGAVKIFKVAVENRVAILFGRAGLTEWELNMLHGLCYQVKKKVQRR